ncbi:MAG: xanthine dehydrogenase family protein molybdopterin-binding subunit [Nitrospinota bacterium]
MASVIGKPIARVEGRDKVTGRFQYVSDTVPPGSLIGKVLRSSIPHGRIAHLDFEDAQKAPGVHMAIGYQDVPRRPFNPIYNQANPHTDLLVKDEVILDDVVRYIGQAVALVVADTEDQAEDALPLIQVKWEELPAVFDMESALRPGAPIVKPGGEGNISFGYRKADRPIHLARGDVERGFAEADYIFEDELKTQRVNPVALEPHVVCCWPEAGNRLAVLSTTQSIFGLRSCLSEALGLSPNKFRVIRPFLGGAFGKGLDMVFSEPLCALAALRLKRPVRIEHTREEEFMRSARHPARMWLKTGLKKSGTLTARHMKTWMDCGASANHGPSVVQVGGGVFIGAYKSPSYLFEGFSVYTNNFPSGAMRGYGAVQTNFAIENHMSRIACEMSFDEFEFRLKNVYRMGDISPVTEFRIDSCEIAECAGRARELIEWDNPKTRTSTRPNVKVGVGMSFCGMKNSGVHGRKELEEKILEYCGALVKINEDGSAALIIASVDQGAGQATILTQIVADTLGIPIESVVVAPTDTDSSPYDAPTHASRITFAAGYSARLAALEAKDKILEAAGRILGVSPESLQIADGVVSSVDSRTKSLTVKEIAEHVHYKQMKEIVGSATSQPPGNPPSFGVQCVKVAVDVETGNVELLEMADAHDIGLVINPLGASGQVWGAFAQGIGLALSEHLVIDETSGAVENAHFGDYKLPTTLDVPLGAVEFVETEESIGVGAKGVAESTIHSPASAIVNAIYDAVGVRVRDLPITPDKILQGISRESS